MIMSINYGRNKNIASDNRKHFAVSLFAERFHRASIVYFHSKYISFRCQRFIELFSELRFEVIFFPLALCVILCLFWYLFIDLPVVLSVALDFSFAFVLLSLALQVALCLSHSTFRSVFHTLPFAHQRKITISHSLHIFPHLSIFSPRLLFSSHTRTKTTKRLTVIYGHRLS